MDGAVVEVDLGQVVHVVPQLGLEDVVGDAGVEYAVEELYACPAEPDDVALHVLGDEEFVGVTEDGTEGMDEVLGLLLVGGETEVAYPLSLDGEGEPGGVGGVYGAGFVDGVHGVFRGIGEALEEGLVVVGGEDFGVVYLVGVDAVDGFVGVLHGEEAFLKREEFEFLEDGFEDVVLHGAAGEVVGREVGGDVGVDGD